MSDELSCVSVSLSADIDTRCVVAGTTRPRGCDWSSGSLANAESGSACPHASAAEGKKRRAPEASVEADPSKTPRAQHPLALVGKLLQQLRKDALRNMCEDLGAPVFGKNVKLIVRIADAM